MSRTSACVVLLMLTTPAVTAAGTVGLPPPRPAPGPLSVRAVGPPQVVPGDLTPAPRPAGLLETLQHDDGDAAYVLNVGPDDIELVKFCPEGHGTIRALRAYLDGLGMPATVEFRIWGNYGNYNVDWDRDFSGPLTFAAVAGGWLDVPLPPAGVRFDAPPCFWVGLVHRGAVNPRLVTDAGACIGAPECTTSFIAQGTPGTYCEPNPQLSYVLYTDECGGVPGNYGQYRYLLRVDFEHDDEVTPTFEDVTTASGLPGASHVAWGDFDGDGHEDLFLGGSAWRNDGTGSFTDVTAAAFGGGGGGGPGVFGDYDNDGFLDLFVFGSTDRLWRNQGDGTFVDVSAAAGDIDDGYPTAAAAWADLDQDGWLDIYKANYEDWNDGNPIYFPDVLLRNQGDGTFRDISEESGIRDAAPASNPLAGRGVNWGDFDGDGCIDIHVSNYRLTPNLLLRNNCDGTFTDVGAATGVAGTSRTGPYAGAYGHTIGSAWGDFDNDGQLDLLQGQLKHQWGRCFQDETFLWRNEGDGTFTEVASEVPIEYQEGHSDVAWGDLDNDGWLDFYVTHVYACQPAQLYLNGRDGRSFRNVTRASGLLTANGWGVAMGDATGDGRLDVFTRGLFLNRGNGGGGPEPGWLKVRLEGAGAPWSNRAAIGARASVVAGGLSMLRQVEGGKGTGTQDSMVLHFGLGRAPRVDSITVAWPSACTDSVLADLDAVPPAATISIDEPCGRLRRSDDPGALADWRDWDPALGTVDDEALAAPVTFYRAATEVRLRVAKDGQSRAVLRADPVLRWRSP